MTDGEIAQLKDYLYNQFYFIEKKINALESITPHDDWAGQGRIAGLKEALDIIKQ